MQRKKASNGMVQNCLRILGPRLNGTAKVDFAGKIVPILLTFADDIGKFCPVSQKCAHEVACQNPGVISSVKNWHRTY
jgi:hypothetical protein